MSTWDTNSCQNVQIIHTVYQSVIVCKAILWLPTDGLLNIWSPDIFNLQWSYLIKKAIVQ